MSGFLKIPVMMSVAAIAVLAGVSCAKRGAGVKSELGDAGYQMTAEDWFRATRENDAAALKKFIASGFKIETRNPDGDAALHVAASAGAKGSVEYLLNRGQSIDLAGAGGRTPLMSAVMADQRALVKFLLQQGADPRAKNQDGFTPLMLAVKQGSSGSVAELAPYTRENLDSALLLAALVGRADVIDSLTNYGASVYSVMEDGRTPLMIAAENGHRDAVELLLDIGASRYAKDPEGRTAAELATASSHPEIAAIILREPLAEELVLESPEKLAVAMDRSVDTAVAKDETRQILAANKADSRGGLGPRSRPTAPEAKRPASRSIDGETLSNPEKIATNPPRSSGTAPAAAAFALPPLVMRNYRERTAPLSVQSVQGDTATISVAGVTSRQVKLRVGDEIPGSSLVVVRVQRKMEDSKVNPGNLVEKSEVEVRDRETGVSRMWIAGQSADAHAPAVLVEDAATGKRYIAKEGQRFKGGDGTEYKVTDVRANQMVIEDLKSGAVQTIPLRGPRG
jgi:ankyrin repeat protein